MTEIWKDIIGYESYYQVSNLGNIRSLDRVINNKKYKGQLKKLGLSENGYYRVSLQKNMERRQFMVHRLVAIMFIDNPSNKSFVNHKDGNKLNNHMNNLE
jgi:hypothetical protein